MKNWFYTKNILPPEGQYVIGYYKNAAWKDNTDNINHKCKIVKLIKGITEEERNKLLNDNPRKKTYSSGDVIGNNHVPYCWKTFGSGKFFGQDIEYWTFIPKFK